MMCSAKPWKSITFLSQVFRPVINIGIFIIAVAVVVVVVVVVVVAAAAAAAVVVVTRRTLQASVGLFVT